MFQSLNIRSKILAAFTIPLLALTALAGVGYVVFQNVKVNGPRYQKIAAAKDLNADILPPPGYIVEAQLAVTSLPLTGTRDRFEDLVRKVARLETEFEKTHQFWQKHLAKNDPARASMAEAYKSGREYFSIVQKSYIPTIQAAVDQNALNTYGHFQSDAAERVYQSRILPLYNTHRAAIDESVKYAVAASANSENSTRSFVTSSLFVLASLAAGALLLSAVIAVFSARSISRPLQDLTADATESAKEGLPRAVAKIQAGEEFTDTVPHAELLEEDNEIGSLARAMNAMRATAVDLASEQAIIRRNVSDNLVNIARRNQLLLKRTLGSISSMEKEERDSTKLERLYELDHLTTRMRRNAESLLVLAGAEGTKLWTSPLVIGDVVRSALSQIEAYDRVDLASMDLAYVKGQAVTDISHMFAEFLENATFFSPPSSRVTVSGRQRLDGYVVVISDDGVGMTAEALAEANDRLRTPTTFVTEPTKVLGITVAAHLAARYGIGVAMLESVSRGVSVQIVLPNAVLQDEVVEKAPAPVPSATPVAQQRSFVSSPAPSSPSLDPVPLVAQPRPAAGQGLARRVRGANLPDTGSGAVAVPLRDADEVRSQLSNLQRGQRAAGNEVRGESDWREASRFEASTGPVSPEGSTDSSLDDRWSFDFTEER